ncbi:MAG TPA: hypothetical protein VLV17_09135 [Anaeromyxobacteraceae bacterium]|nr:hypothetical protein [Anaeromyxobacteraceae bacterium]
MNDDRLDLSALDPKRDPLHFERMVRAVVLRGRPRVHPVFPVLLGWGKVAVTCAALLALSAWIPAVLRWRQGESRTPDRLALVSSWAEAGSIPSDADLFWTIEAGRGR